MLFLSDEDEEILKICNGFVDETNDNAEDLDPHDIDDGDDDVETSVACQNLDQYMRTHIEQIIENLSRDEMIQKILGEIPPGPPTKFEKKGAGIRKKGV